MNKGEHKIRPYIYDTKRDSYVVTNLPFYNLDSGFWTLN